MDIDYLGGVVNEASRCSGTDVTLHLVHPLSSNRLNVILIPHISSLVNVYHRFLADNCDKKVFSVNFEVRRSSESFQTRATFESNK